MRPLHAMMICAFVFGCDSTDDAPAPPPGPEATGCAPTAADFEAIAPIVERYCGDCHGDTPSFGAPMTLTDFEQISPHLERVRARVEEGTMPPAGQPSLPASDRGLLLDWASCGTADLTPNVGGFDVSREVFPDPGRPPADTEVLELTAANGGIAPDSVDQYRCFGFGGTDEPRFIRRLEALIDDPRVVHHMILYQADGGAIGGSEVACGTSLGALIYGWAPGAQGLTFPGGGLRTGPGVRYILEVHYNNPAGLEDVVDHSGVRLFHGPPEGKEYGMLTLGPEGFDVPPNSQATIGSACDLPESLEIIAATPHMHGIGYRLQSTVHRADGAQEDLITVSDWDFNAQYVYSTPLRVAAGDRIVTECTFRNMSDRTVGFGGKTTDEMCYNFVLVSPPPREGQCGTLVGEPLPEGYVAGECVGPAVADIEVPEVEGRFFAGEPPELTGGEIEPGTYALTSMAVWVDSYELSVVTLDPEQTRMWVHGTAQVTEDGMLHLDHGGRARIVTANGFEVERRAAKSESGSITQETETTLRFDRECGEEKGPLSLPYSAAPGAFEVEQPHGQIEAVLRLRFTAVE